jgi:uncharacterized protein YlxP (DUF503 family)
MEIITVENLGVPIWEHRCRNGEIVTIPDNACRDISREVYEELKEEYNLRVVNTASADIPQSEMGIAKTEQPKIKMDDETKNNDFLEGLKKASVFICSVCDKKFDTNHGMRLHMKKAHEI